MLFWHLSKVAEVSDQNLVIQNFSNRILKAITFAADANLDAHAFSFRVCLLQHGKEGALVLSMTSRSTFQELLFQPIPSKVRNCLGDALEKILIEIGRRPSGVSTDPQVYQQKDPSVLTQSFRSHHTLPRSKWAPRRADWRYSRQTFKRGSHNARLNK